MSRPDRVGPEEYRLGIDVGGTNTDAVIVDAGGAVVAKVKVPSTGGFGIGVQRAIAKLLGDSKVDTARIRSAMLGTRRVTDAMHTASGLRRVAVLRIGAPLTHMIPPLAEWPADLHRAVYAGTATIAGGCEFDGTRIAPLDEKAIAEFAAKVGRHAAVVAITAVFSSVDPADELRAAEIMRQELGEVPISLSHEVGTMGLVERENATVLNAALSGVAADVMQAFSAAVRRSGLDAECYVTQNDGTLMALEYSTRFAVLTISSGPANGMRGGAQSSGIADAVVADIGGARTAVGRLVQGFPWESPPPNTIGGVSTNFRVPHLRVVPFGGGSIVRGTVGQWANGRPHLGGTFARESLCFGGATPTLTDAAVAARRATTGTHPIPKKWITRLPAHLAESDALLADAIDRVRLGAEDLPLVVVGGGGHIAPDNISGVCAVIRPPHLEVANALGAATAPVSGQAERICASRPDRREAIDMVSAEAIAHAVQAGADPSLVRVVDVDEVPLTYLRDPAVRIKVRAIGPPMSFPRRTELPGRTPPHVAPRPADGPDGRT